MRNTWLVWSLQHRHSSGRLWPRSPGSSPSPCQSEGLAAPGDPPLLLPAFSPSMNAAQSWAHKAAILIIDRTHFPKLNTISTFSLVDASYVLSDWSRELFPFPLSASEYICSLPLILWWMSVSEEQAEKKPHKKHTQQMGRSLCTLPFTFSIPPLPLSISLYPTHLCRWSLMKHDKRNPL